MNEAILEFLFGSGQYSQAIAPLVVAGIAQGVSSLVGAFSAGAQRREAARAAKRQNLALKALEKSRQAVINPYENVQDLSGMITNPYANLQVSTGAAQMQAEQIDIGLASTLDVLRATGSGAGGATALAREAALSKQGIAADIQRQEVANAQLRAQGEQQMQRMQMAEKARVQSAEAAGKQFMFQATETREVAQLNRAQSMLDQYRAQEAQAKTAQNQAIGSLIGTAASFGAQALGGSFGGGSQESASSAGGTQLGYSSSYSNPLGNANQFLPTGTSYSNQFQSNLLGSNISAFSSQYGGQRFVPSTQLGG